MLMLMSPRLLWRIMILSIDVIVCTQDNARIGRLHRIMISVGGTVYVWMSISISLEH